MNIPALETLAADLRQKPRDQFHLGFWFGNSHDTSPDHWVPTTPACQTCACIAGDTLKLFDPDTPIRPVDIPARAGEILGLSDWQADCLFQPVTKNSWDDEPYYLPRGRSYGDITPHEAAAVIDHLIATGEVDWRVIH